MSGEGRSPNSPTNEERAAGPTFDLALWRKYVDLVDDLGVFDQGF
jgi:hypothetical protein